MRLRRLHDKEGISGDIASFSHGLLAFNCDRRSVSTAVVPVYAGNIRPATTVNGSAPLTILSSEPRLLCGCFHRRFTRIAGPTVSPVHRRLIVSLARCVNHINDNVLAPSRDGYGVIHLPRPVLAGARLSLLYGVHCGNFGARGLPLLFSPTRNISSLHHRLTALYGGTRRDISGNIGCVVLSSHSISTARTTVPTLLTIDTIRRCLVSINGHIRATLVIRSKRVHRIVRTTLLLNCNTDTVGPCVTFTVLSSLIGHHGVTRRCIATRGGCVHTISGNLGGVVSGVNVSAVHSCHKTGLFRTVNLSSALLRRCFNADASSVNNVNLSAVTHSTIQVRDETCRDSSACVGASKLFSCHGSNVLRT